MKQKLWKGTICSSWNVFLSTPTEEAITTGCSGMASFHQDQDTETQTRQNRQPHRTSVQFKSSLIHNRELNWPSFITHTWSRAHRSAHISTHTCVGLGCYDVTGKWNSAKCHTDHGSRLLFSFCEAVSGEFTQVNTCQRQNNREKEEWQTDRREPDVEKGVTASVCLRCGCQSAPCWCIWWEPRRLLPKKKESECCSVFRLSDPVSAAWR